MMQLGPLKDQLETFGSKPATDSCACGKMTFQPLAARASLIFLLTMNFSVPWQLMDAISILRWLALS